MDQKRFLLAATILGVVALATPIWAGTLTVTTLDDAGPGSLRQAIVDANSLAGTDTITFTSGLSGTIELASAFDPVAESLSITGPGPSLLTVDANGHGRVLELAGMAGEVFQVTGLTLTGGATSGSDTGAGIWLASGQTLTLEDVHVVDNRAGLPDALRKGGGLFTSSGSATTIRRSFVARNSANQGGGICSYGDVTVEQSAIVDNSARLEGGGVWVFSGNATLTESTIARNIATGDSPTISFGGGIFITSGAALTLYHATITTNWASIGPGIKLYDTGIATTVANTVIAGNRYVGSGSEGNCSPALDFIDAHNLAGDDSCGFDGAADLESTDPMLHSLAWAGGPTPSHVPMAASPVLDAGSADFCISVDQRDLFRPTDGDSVPGAECDVGAVELQPGAEDLITARDFEWPNPLDRWSSASN